MTNKNFFTLTYHKETTENKHMIKFQLLQNCLNKLWNKLKNKQKNSNIIHDHHHLLFEEKTKQTSI